MNSETRRDTIRVAAFTMIRRAYPATPENVYTVLAEIAYKGGSFGKFWNEATKRQESNMVNAVIKQYGKFNS